MGDQVLIESARRLNSCVLESDLVIRLGGDEFAVIGSGLEDPRAAALLAERIVKSISQPMLIEERQVLVGASIGAGVVGLTNRKPLTARAAEAVEMRDFAGTVSTPAGAAAITRAEF